MKTLRETWGSEVRFTQHLATDPESLNRVNDLVGLPRVVSAVNEQPIPGGSIDVVGFTQKGHVVIYEHQDQGGRADQTHVSKTQTYAHQMRHKGYTVLAAILLCESVDEHYLAQFRSERREYLRRKRNGHKNLHCVRSQWSDSGEYHPELFEDSDAVILKEETELDTFQDFVRIYAADWMILREERNGAARTLWHRVPGQPSRFVCYVHCLKQSVKIGCHCVKSVSDEDRALLKSLSDSEWQYREAEDRATVEIVLSRLSTEEQWADATEQLKRRIRAKGLTT